VQDRYAGDLGDFSKLALLRALVGSPGAPSQAGLLWWRSDDESHNNDGRHIAYLHSDRPHWRRLRSLDPELAERLRGVVDSGQRSVASLERAGVLPPGTATHAEKLSFEPRQSRASRAARRAAWFAEALAAVEGCDLVFLDPDNGLEVTSIGRTGVKGPKYVYFDELAALQRPTRSLVVYQHAHRRGPLHRQVEGRAEQIRDALGLGERPWALIFRRGTARIYFVIPSAAQRSALEARLTEFLREWAGTFERR
jgi:hypothetical protein